MLRVGDFRYADCERFWKPTIDTGAVQEAIEAFLTKSFDDDATVDDAMERVLQTDAARTLVGKIAGNVDYQKRIELDHIAEAKQQAIETVEQQKCEALDSVKQGIGVLRQEKEVTYDSAQKEKVRQIMAYSAEQQRLDEMKQRVREQLREIGGEKGYEILLGIEHDLEKKEESDKDAKLAEVGRGLDLAAAQNVDPLKGAVPERKRYVATYRPKGMMAKFWDYLNSEW